jgi:dihydrofolate reductase
MIKTIVAAHDPNLVIGREGGLPWRYPEDLKHFKKTTLGHTIIMGRGVFEELNEIPLPGRTNVVLSTTRSYENVATYNSLREALDACDEKEVFIIGGGVLYRDAMDIADKMIITEIHKEYEGDTYFPEYRDDIDTVWKEIERDDSEELSFVTYQRK